MNTTSRYITGTIGLVISVFLITLGIKLIVSLIYGVAIFIISVFILFNKKEDNIEPIKNQNKIKSKK